MTARPGYITACPGNITAHPDNITARPGHSAAPLVVLWPALVSLRPIADLVRT